MHSLLFDQIQSLFDIALPAADALVEMEAIDEIDARKRGGVLFVFGVHWVARLVEAQELSLVRLGLGRPSRR